MTTETEIPIGGVAEIPRGEYEISAYKMPDGTRHVVLIDDTEKTWEAYCAQNLADLRKSFPKS